MTEDTRRIRNAANVGGTRARETALACIEAGIEATHPKTLVHESVRLDGDTLHVEGTSYDLAGVEDVLVVGGGKAAGQVAAELEAILGDRIARGAVVTNDPVATTTVEVIEGDHPVPSERGEAGARRVLEIAEGADDDDLVVAVLTGGGSALLPSPAGEIDLAAIEDVTEELLDSGADIHEINAVRKHCSVIKGGGLARAATPATVVGLAFSDVVGDDLDVIASGPTAPDDSTFADAVAVLDRYGIDAPPSVRQRLETGAAGDVAETPRADDPVFDRAENHVIATNLAALEAASAAAVDRDHEPLILSSRVRGEASTAALTHVAIAEECLASGNPIESPAVILSGGETTVTVTGDGTGGPNQEFALAAALDLPDEAVLAAVDTDGEDGATDAAGALVDGSTVESTAAARDALDANDAYSFLAERDALLFTGRTGTNVNDLRVLVIDAPES